MSTLQTIGKWTFRLLPVAVLAVVAGAFAIDHFDTPRRADRFIAHWAHIFADNPSIPALRALPQSERPDLIYIRQFENDQWIAARTEFACGNGAGFDATVFGDSEGSIYFQKGYHICGHDALKFELGKPDITNLAALYATMKNMHFTEWKP